MRAAVLAFVLLATPSLAEERLSDAACGNADALGREFGYSVQLMFFNSFYPTAVQSQTCERSERVTVPDVQAAIMSTVAEAGCSADTTGYVGFEAVIAEWLGEVDLASAEISDLPPPLVSNDPNFCTSDWVAALASCEGNADCLQGVGQ